MTRNEECLFYEGIFDVMLNFSISISFIPYFEHNPDHWPSILYSLIPFDEVVARVDMADWARYIITPNDTRKKDMRYVSLGRDFSEGYPYSRDITLFYVLSEQLSTCQAELFTLAEHIGSGIHSFSPAATIEKLSFVRFLQDIVIKSEQFDLKDKRLLCR